MGLFWKKKIEKLTYDWLKNLEVTELDLTAKWNVQVEVLHSHFFTLKKLTKLNLSNNQEIFEDLEEREDPENFFTQIENCYNLEYLDLSNNNIAFLFENEADKSFENFTKLKVLKLINCNIKKISIDFTKLKKLEKIELTGNKNIQFIGDSICKCKELTIIGVDSFKKQEIKF